MGWSSSRRRGMSESRDSSRSSGKRRRERSSRSSEEDPLRFVWKKKIERDVALGADLDMFSIKAEKKRQKERMAEIEKVKKRREERALEKAQHEEEMAMLARERAREEFQDWEKKEEEFHFYQSKVRSEIRLREGRAKAIDSLSKHLHGSDDLDIELNEPYMVFKGLTVKETEELRGNIKMHLALDIETPTHIEYWKALLVVCDWELAEARKKDALDRARACGEEPPAELLAEERGVHSKIEADVRDYLHKKTYSELEYIHAGVEARLRSGTAHVVEFWEVILKCIHIYKAQAFLKEFHTKMLRKHHLQRPEKPVDVVDKPETANVLSPIQEEGVPDDEGSLSPEPLPGTGAEEVDLGSHATRLLDYRPSKPEYLNRVHTGYEWNEYNWKHYDHDHPPPKTVHGYKFNIFYPDLVDKTEAPTCTFEKDGNSTETCIIRFHAGPPYEDIAFRIVNKEWEYSRKKGFRYTFDGGSLHVYFNFKRLRYHR